MAWLKREGRLVENLILHLDDATQSSILDYSLSGQGRVTSFEGPRSANSARWSCSCAARRRTQGERCQEVLQPEGSWSLATKAATLESQMRSDS